MKTASWSWILGVGLLFCGSNSVQADWTTAICGPFDPDCSRRMSKLTQKGHFFPVQVGGGVRIGEDQSSAVVSFQTEALSVDRAAGDLQLIAFDVNYLPGDQGLRIRLSVADSEVLFFCKSVTQGDWVAPGLSLVSSCREGGSFGLGGTVLQGQVDTQNGRVGLRWVELNAVLNILGNAHTRQYLGQRLQTFAGASLDTVFGEGTAVRLNLGLTGMIRSTDNKWELRGLAGYRPNLTQWSDYSVETKIEGLYRLLFTPEAYGEFGLKAAYEYHSVPSLSISEFATGTSEHNGFLGAIFGLKWN